MAYLDLREGYGSAVTMSAPRISALFEPIEWDVIILARRDSLDSLQPPGWLSKFAARLFGGAPARRLASARLESLRRLAVLAWHHGYDIPSMARQAFLEAGFSVEQMAQLLGTISSSQFHRRTAR